MRTLDRAVVKALMRDSGLTQGRLAAKVGVDVRKVRGSLLRLRKSGVIELDREGQRQLPRLTVLRDVVDSVNRLESAVLSLVEAITPEAA
jgi:predicted transcriptional regulator